MDSKFVALAVWSAVGLLTYGAISQVLSPNRAEENIDNARRLGWKQRFDIVFIGDSRTHNCAAPSAMREALPGLRLANYGWSSLGWGAEVLASAKATLDPSGARVVVIGASPIAFTQRSATQNAFLDTARSAWLDRWAVPKAPAATNFFSVYGPNQWLRSLNPELGSVPFRIHEDGWYEATTKPLNGARIVRMYADRCAHRPSTRNCSLCYAMRSGRCGHKGSRCLPFARLRRRRCARSSSGKVPIKSTSSRNNWDPQARSMLKCLAPIRPTMGAI